MSRVRNLQANWRRVLAGVLVRHRGDLSIRQHAKQLGLGYATLHRLERGLGADIDTLVKISAATGFGMDELLLHGLCEHEWEETGGTFKACRLCPAVGVESDA